LSRGAGELIQLGQGFLVLAAPGGFLGSNDVGERGDTHLHVPDAAAQQVEALTADPAWRAMLAPSAVVGVDASVRLRSAYGEG